MASSSTLSGMGRGSRGKVHIEAVNGGNLCHSLSSLRVSGEYAASCKRCLKMARGEPWITSGYHAIARKAVK